MGFLIDMFREAWDLLTSFDPEFRSILWLTLLVSGAATAIGVVVGVPLGVALGAGRFRGRGAAMAIVNTGMGMPPVLAGLVLLLLLWNDGPLGAWGLLFTPIAMIGAQALLAIPIAAGVTAGAVRSLPPEAHEQVRALQLGRSARGVVLAREAWPGVAAGAAAAFGRVVSEVGAVLVVGGNIEGETRVLTTAIVQEARRADFGAALALGIVLLVLALTVNAFLTWFQLRET